MLLSKGMSDRKKFWEEDAAQMLLRKNQVTTVRYKVYLFFLWVFLFMFEPMVTGLVEEVRWEWAFSLSLANPIAMFTEVWEWWMVNDLNEIENSIQEVIDETKAVKIEKELIELLSDQEKQNTLIKCLNNQDCDDIDPIIISQIKFLRVFMMMNYLGGEKMEFDQKTLLRSINEFLNKTPWWLTNWTIQWITFWTPSVLSEEYSINTLELTISMEFDHKRNLISFLENLENKVFRELPVLYVISSINYDIVNYTERQAVNILTDIYYFDGEPPENQVEKQELSDVQAE